MYVLVGEGSGSMDRDVNRANRSNWARVGD